MYMLKEKMKTMKCKLGMFSAKAMMRKDAGESHVITVIAMCVIGIALVLILFGALDPMIETMCTTMDTKINSMFNSL